MLRRGRGGRPVRGARRLRAHRHAAARRRAAQASARATGSALYASTVQAWQWQSYAFVSTSSRLFRHLSCYWHCTNKKQIFNRKALEQARAVIAEARAVEWHEEPTEMPWPASAEPDHPTAATGTYGRDKHLMPSLEPQNNKSYLRSRPTDNVNRRNTNQLAP